MSSAYSGAGALIGVADQLKDSTLWGALMLAQGDTAAAFRTWTTASRDDRHSAYATYREALGREDVLHELLARRALVTSATDDGG